MICGAFLYGRDMRIKKKQIYTVIALCAAVFTAAVVSLLVGSSGMSAKDCLRALAGEGSAANVRIIRNIRIPRMLAAFAAGAGLSVSGLVMQTVLNNSMASPSTLGVSNAAVFGANLSIIAFSGGFLNTGNNVSVFSSQSDPFSAGLVSFAFAVVSVLLILGLSRLRSFSPGVVVLSGIALGSVWSAATTILQFYATDVGLSAAVIWSFGDLGRATNESAFIMLFVVGAAVIFFSLLSWRYNALLSGETTALSLGVNVSAIRFVSLLISSLVTAVCVSSLGIIGFIGIICPHAVKRLLGQDHRISVLASALMGSFLLLSADIVSRTLGNGSALPVGALTSALGAPFFLVLILSRRKEENA